MAVTRHALADQRCSVACSSSVNVIETAILISFILLSKDETDKHLIIFPNMIHYTSAASHGGAGLRDDRRLAPVV